MDFFNFKQPSELNAYLKIGDIAGESYVEAYLKLPDIDGESQSTATLKIGDIAGESFDAIWGTNGTAFEDPLLG